MKDAEMSDAEILFQHSGVRHFIKTGKDAEMKF